MPAKRLAFLILDKLVAFINIQSLWKQSFSQVKKIRPEVAGRASYDVLVLKK